MIIKIAEKHYGEKIERIIREIDYKQSKSNLDKNVKYQKLLHKYINQPVDVIPGAVGIYMQIVHMCDAFAKSHLGYIRAEISLAELTACVYLSFLRLNIDKRDLDFLKKVIEISSSVQFSAEGRKISIKIIVKMFANGISPATKALNEMYNKKE